MIFVAAFVLGTALVGQDRPSDRDVVVLDAALRAAVTEESFEKFVVVAEMTRPAGFSSRDPYYLPVGQWQRPEYDWDAQRLPSGLLNALQNPTKERFCLPIASPHFAFPVLTDDQLEKLEEAGDALQHEGKGRYVVAWLSAPSYSPDSKYAIVCVQFHDNGPCCWGSMTVVLSGYDLEWTVMGFTAMSIE